MISIIIPVYNAQETISKCIDSIMNNNFNKYEIIAINDGSSDNSLKILRDYEKRYPEKIRVFDQENQGVARTRNNGVAYAKGAHVMFIDNDDYVDSDYLEKFQAEIGTKDLDMVIGGYRRTNGEKTLFEMRLQDVEWSKYMMMAPWAKIYRKNFLVEHEIEFLDNNIGEDVYFNLQAINLTNKILILDYCGYNWFYNELSVSNSLQKNIKNELNVMFLLNSCYDKLKGISISNKKEVEFYFTRYVVWYLLFAGRKSSYAEICSEFEKIFIWLEEKFPNFQKNKNISMLLPKGETLKNRLVVYVFMYLYKLSLIRIFLKFYAIK